MVFMIFYTISSMYKNYIYLQKIDVEKVVSVSLLMHASSLKDDPHMKHLTIFSPNKYN